MESNDGKKNDLMQEHSRVSKIGVVARYVAVKSSFGNGQGRAGVIIIIIITIVFAIEGGGGSNGYKSSHSRRLAPFHRAPLQRTFRI